MVCPIKFQTGYKYWEDRVRKFYNKLPQTSPEYLCTLSYKGKRNYGVAAMHRELNIAIVLEDCKFGMAEGDVLKVENWVRGVNKPIVNSPQKMQTQKVKLKPLLDLL